MGTVKDRNGMDLTEAEKIKKRWQEYTKEYTKKIFTIQIITMVWLLTYSQTSWSVKWALGSITTNNASGGNGISADLFQILKEDTVKVLHSINQQIWKLSSGHRTGNG